MNNESWLQTIINILLLRCIIKHYWQINHFYMSEFHHGFRVLSINFEYKAPYLLRYMQQEVGQKGIEYILFFRNKSNCSFKNSLRPLPILCTTWYLGMSRCGIMSTHSFSFPILHRKPWQFHFTVKMKPLMVCSGFEMIN